MMGEKSMPISGKEARERALAKVADLERLSEELSTILKELPIPTPEEFEAMRNHSVPWTLEAYIAAVINRADFFVDEARVIITDYGSETSRGIQARWKNWNHPSASLERSLRYLVEERTGQKIEPSVDEELFHKPERGMEALLFGILGRVLR
jgi:hypothetical protein